MIMTINLSGYKANRDGCGTITLGTAGSYGIEKLQIVPDDIWKGLSITAAFVRGDVSTVVLVPPDGVIDVPAEATAEPTFSGKIVFKGVKSGQRVFTIDVPYIVDSHSGADGDTPTPPTPSEIEQITMLAQSAEEKAQSVVDAAERGDFDGDPGPAGPQGPQGPKGDKGDPAEPLPYLSIERLRSYAYRVTFGELPEETGVDSPGAGCSSYVQDGKLYRNLDWDYSNLATFHVKCSGFEGMAFLPGLTDTALDNGLIGQLPYHLVDGRNDAGIMVSEHVLYNDWGWGGTGDTPLYKLPYLILSRVKTMTNFPAQMADILADVYATPMLTEIEYLLQFLVTDGTTTYAIMPPESASGSYVAVNITANPKLTNFRWVANETVERADLQERPTGVERWNMMPCPLSDLRFTAAYETPDRLSEFIGIDGTTKYSTDAELEAIYDRAHAAYQTRTRDGATWQTMHSALYSADAVEGLNVQENFAQNLAGIGQHGGGAWTDITGKPFATIGENLKVVNGVLSVDTAPNVEQDNTKPITSAAVYTEVGNIAALLASI